VFVLLVNTSVSVTLEIGDRKNIVFNVTVAICNFIYSPGNDKNTVISIHSNRLLQKGLQLRNNFADDIFCRDGTVHPIAAIFHLIPNFHKREMWHKTSTEIMLWKYFLVFVGDFAHVRLLSKPNAKNYSISHSSLESK